MTKKLSTRDYSLDFFRACLLAYIVCIIHSLGWLKNGAEPYISWCMFEMPLIFFVAGAAANLAGYNGKTFRSILSSRTKRVLLPYVIYVIISVILSIAICVFNGSELINLTARNLGIAVLLGGDLPSVPYAWQLWFIPVYFFISISTPLQAWLIKKLNGRKWVYFTLCVSIWGIVSILIRLYPIKHNISQIITQILIYNIFYMAGYLFYKWFKLRTIMWMALIAIAFLYILTGGDISEMNSHKFSQDHIFLTFGFVALLVFSIIFSFVRVGNSSTKLFRFGLDRWNKYGYTFYLWQSWSFFVLVTLAEIIDIPVQNSPTSLFWVVPGLYIISWLLSWIIVPVEQYLVRTFSHNSSLSRQIR